MQRAVAAARYGRDVRRLLVLLTLSLLALPGAAAAAPSITAAPIRTVAAGQGTIGYRTLGHGRPLVMVMGLSGTMDSWPVRFVDALAAHRRVIIFDNPGIRSSTLGSAPLTIGRMGDDTASLIRALGVRRADVLGWSLGGMVAQALAIRHPRLVRRVVLAATAPGDGHGTLPGAAPLAALSGAGPQGLLGLAAYLFPPGDTTFLPAYLRGFAAWPAVVPVAPAEVTSKQFTASGTWIVGADPAGRPLRRMAMPVLVGAGTQDELLPVANDRYLARALPHARLREYADSAHGFFIQHPMGFARVVRRFLG